MPLRSGYVLSAVLASLTAVGVSHFVAYSTVLKFGYFDWIIWLQPSVRSLPFREARSPSRIAMCPLLLVACEAMYLQEFMPYSTLSARTIMKTLPLLGATSTLTTGIFLLAAKSSAGAIAALSTGLTISAWAPSWISVWMSAICLAESLFATSGPISVALYWVANCVSYLM